MRILGLDIGDRKTGIAIADTSASVAIPKGVIRDAGRDETISQIVKLIQDENIDLVVAGIPYNLKGEVAHQAEKVLTFIKHMKKAVKIPVETVDERLTSKSYKGMGNDDSLAAASILQTWLDQKLTSMGENE